MSRQQEHKVIEYNKENYNKYWYNDKKNNK